MADSGNNFVSLAVYNRMPVYLKALLALKRDGKKFVSSVILADYVRENPSLVKKRLILCFADGRQAESRVRH